MNAFQVVKDFEAALCEYTGAKYAVTVNSCTAALLLAVRWNLRIEREQIDATSYRFLRPALGKRPWEDRPEIEIPKRTYVGVACSIIHAGGRPTYRDEAWSGAYQLKPLPVWDSARYFTSGLYKGKHPFAAHHRSESAMTLITLERDCSGQMVCVSFHWAKTLGIQQGGAILHDNDEADSWLRRARFDGRCEGVPPAKQTVWDVVGHHCYMSPEVAAAGLVRLAHLPKHNEPLPNDEYPDLSTLEIFR